MARGVGQYSETAWGVARAYACWAMERRIYGYMSRVLLLIVAAYRNVVVLYVVPSRFLKLAAGKVV